MPRFGSMHSVYHFFLENSIKITGICAQGTTKRYSCTVHSRHSYLFVGRFSCEHEICPQTVRVNCNRYTDVFYSEDYIQYLYDFISETSVYRDTSILESDVREKTDFYIKFLKPEDIIFGCGIILIKNSRIIGMFNLFRNEKSGDFNEKELYVLNLLKNHIANMLHNVMRLDRASITVNKSLNNFAKTYGLTSRESEILSLINKGLSNQEISDKVVISVSTVKKHIYNIYNKTGVSSRGQLISLFLE